MRFQPPNVIHRLEVFHSIAASAVFLRRIGTAAPSVVRIPQGPAARLSDIRTGIRRWSRG